MAAILFFSLLASVQAHTFFQKVSVNGVDQGDTYGVRIPTLNWPMKTVDDPNFACNSDITTQDSNIITIPQGATVGTWWDHAIGGGSGPDDPDSPIASSHKGPLQAYLAAVDDPVSANGTGLQWFKVAHEGLNNGLWAVDNLKTNGGWWTFTMPSCVPAGKYLMRAEIIALHGAFQVDGAQYYAECAQVEVTGSGTSTPATVSFPGAYSNTDPGIYISIYDGNGAPTNNGNPYTIPGPAPLQCSGGGSGGSSPSSPASPSSKSSSKPTTMATVVSVSSSSSSHRVAAAAATAVASNSNTGGSSSSSPSGGGSMEQCGGDGWTGSTTCKAGTCSVLNQWVSLCM